MSSHQRKPPSSALTALATGELEVKGQIVQSSNFTFLVGVDLEGERSQAIYKPLDGEEPLFDFPAGLYKREVAAYELASHLGWPNVPETIVREDAPYGVGSLQRFVEAKFEEHYFLIREDEARMAVLESAFRDVALFDIVINNTDRKAGHCLIDAEDTIWCIDHGLTFHEDFKLRTVLWDFGGDPIAEDRIEQIAPLMDEVPAALSDLLSSDEIEALQLRVAEIIREPVFPYAVDRRQYPWPLL